MHFTAIDSECQLVCNAAATPAPVPPFTLSGNWQCYYVVPQWEYWTGNILLFGLFYKAILELCFSSFWLSRWQASPVLEHILKYKSNGGMHPMQIAQRTTNTIIGNVALAASIVSLNGLLPNLFQGKNRKFWLCRAFPLAVLVTNRFTSNAAF